MADKEFSEKYPLHVELKARQGEARVLGEFLDWLDQRGLEICEFNTRREEYFPDRASKTDRIGAFMGIDPQALEAEKRAMLDELSRA